MKSDGIVVRCPRCNTKNRIPFSRWGGAAVCGKCGAGLDLSHLYPDRTIDVTDQTFQSEVVGFPGPVAVEFTAPW